MEVTRETAKKLLFKETAKSFGKRMARACDEIRSSHVYFIVQQAYPDIADCLMWEDVQDLLNKILKEK